VEEAQALAAEQTLQPEVDYELEDLVEKERERHEKDKKKRRKSSFREQKKATKLPPPYRRLARARVELRELRIKDIDHRSTFIPVLHPCNAVTVRRKLGASLKRPWKDIRLIYLGALLKDDTIIPEGCYTTRRFNFLRWIDTEALDDHLRRIKEAEVKEQAEAAKMLRLLRERQALQAKEKQQQTEADLLERALSDLDLESERSSLSPIPSEIDTDTIDTAHSEQYSSPKSQSPRASPRTLRASTSFHRTTTRSRKANEYLAFDLR